MAEKQSEKKYDKAEALKAEKAEKAAKKMQPTAEESEVLVRIYGYDIPGSKNLYTGLTRIKGISWAIANATCIKLGYSKSKKIHELTKQEIAAIENFLDTLDVPDFLKNRRRDRETGKTEHFYGTDLEMKRDFDIKRLREIRSYKGVRHALKLPVRGQRTRSHFRTKKAASISTKKKEAKR
ncbi:MAG TPA: 30S ribosomal protein S13 [Candidatus Nanoarchaeia archaeon]|nr:30S ribosomal protein S13 [Candidatus Nanoarchaeia archaeon]